MSAPKKRKPKRAAEKDDPARMSKAERERFDKEEREAWEASARHIINNKDVLALFAAEMSKIIAGERDNAKLLYLIATSRLFPKTMHAALKGTSSGGKSILRTEVLKFFPDEDVVSFTSLTEKALLYLPDSLAHRILSMGEAAGAEEQSLQDYLLRELISEGRLRHMVAQKVGGEIITNAIEKEGPVSFLVTTTKGLLHPENETRLLSLDIDDTESQTRIVLAKVAEVEGLQIAGSTVDVEPWQDFQRWLAAGNRSVVIPFAGDLAGNIPPAAVRLRRDFGQVLRAIQAHALIHRAHRATDDAGRIVATLDDYVAVRLLLNGIISASSGVAVKPTVRETVQAVQIATVNIPKDDGATAFEVAKLMKLDKSAAWRRLQTAMGEGFVVNMETKRGQPGRYRLSGQSMDEILMLPELPFSQKPVQPCNRTQKAEIDQEDSGCKPGCTGNATALATANPMGANGKSPPVARLQGFHAPTEEDLEIPGPPEAVRPLRWRPRVRQPRQPGGGAGWADARAGSPRLLLGLDEGSRRWRHQ
jgi:hypothetical protein